MSRDVRPSRDKAEAMNPALLIAALAQVAPPAGPVPEVLRVADALVLHSFREPSYDCGRVPRGGPCFGRIATGVGDLDGDGRADVAVGPVPHVFDQAVQVRSGRSGEVLVEYVDERVWTIAPLGDLDGNGVPEVAVGSGEHTGIAPRGRVRVFSGIDPEPVLELGPGELRPCGTVLAGMGDWDGDGVGDLVLGPPAVQVVSGRDGTGLFLPEGPDSLAMGFGSSLACSRSAGRGGRPRLWIGSPGERCDGSRAGLVRAYSPGSTAARAALCGTGRGARFGAALGIAGDVDRDGVEDPLVGSPGWGSGRGRVVVVSGRSAEVLYCVDGERPGSALGWSVAGGADLDGDGVADWIAGAPGDPDGAEAPGGSVVAISGREGRALVRIEEPSLPGFGGAVAIAGDVDGDGVPDAIVGAFPLRSGDGQGAVIVLSGARLGGRSGETPAGDR